MLLDLLLLLLQQEDTIGDSGFLSVSDVTEIKANPKAGVRAKPGNLHSRCDLSGADGNFAGYLQVFLSGHEQEVGEKELHGNALPEFCDKMS